jgi:hypothetical protein
MTLIHAASIAVRLATFFVVVWVVLKMIEYTFCD